MQQIKRGLFDNTRKQEYKDMKIEIWPGFTTALVQTDVGPLFNPELMFKVLRTGNTLDSIVTLTL